MKVETNYHESAKLVTEEAVKQFLVNCRDRGLAVGTISHYSGYLRHFALAFPDGLPWSWVDIERFLNRIIKKKSARPAFKKALQALYSYLEKQGLGKSPIPPGRVGRPPKVRPTFSESAKLGRGGSDKPIRIELHIFVHRASS